MIDPENVFHVLPVDDIKPHVEKCTYPLIGMPFCDCPCEPEYREVIETNGLIIIHNSFDGREGVEWAEEILNLKSDE